MSRCRDLIAVIAVVLAVGPAFAGQFGLGRPALPDEIAAWDLDVRPDGTGLPPGAGSVSDGDLVFADRCAICHGDFAEGVDNWPTLSGGLGTLDQDDPVKTPGSFWPYLSTLWDYIHRSKPYGNAQTLGVDEVYALVAYLLYSSDIVDDDFVLTQDNFLSVRMPNADGFVIDDRAAVEYPRFSQAPCTQGCKDAVVITARASALDVTPQSGAQVEGGNDQALVAAGEKVFRKCKACHQIGDGARNKTGPSLTGIVNAPVGASQGFRYSDSMKAAGRRGLVWTPKELAAFLANPKIYMKGTKMSYAGLKKEDDVKALIAYLSSFSG